jgi:hypothetical protein
VLSDALRTDDGELRFAELEGRASILDERGRVVSVSPWLPNAYANEGKADVLNVYYREQAHKTKYLGLYTNAALTEATTMSSVTEPGAGYARVALAAGTWSAPSDPGDGNRQISYTQQTFGPAGEQWPVKGVFVTTTAADLTGLLILYVPHVATVESGQSFLFTLRNKTRNP